MKRVHVHNFPWPREGAAAWRTSSAHAVAANSAARGTARCPLEPHLTPQNGTNSVAPMGGGLGGTAWLWPYWFVWGLVSACLSSLVLLVSFDSPPLCSGGDGTGDPVTEPRGCCVGSWCFKIFHLKWFSLPFFLAFWGIYLLCFDFFP